MNKGIELVISKELSKNFITPPKARKIIISIMNFIAPPLFDCNTKKLYLM